MKCPECGQWNRASMPHCIKCGAPLNIDEISKLQWKDTLKDGGPSTAYLRADEFGQMDATPDARDQLAGEMQELKKRKQEGAELQNRMRGKTERRPDAEVVVTEESGVRSRKARHDDVPVTAVRVQPSIRNEQERRRESEIWHRVRYMDENGAFAESRTYDPAPAGGYSQGTGSWYLAGPLGSHIAPRRDYRRHTLKILLVLLIIAVLGTGGYVGYRFFSAESDPVFNQDAIVTASLLDDLPAHTILIPGEDGTSIYIRELHASYVVVDGFATIQVADHVWYDNLEGALDDTMNITLTPFLKTASGRQQPLALVSYDISIPLSPIRLDSPETLRSNVSTTMKAIQLTVRPGSRVFINDKEYTDMVSKEGEVSCNVTVHPIGDNTFRISVRAQYCRENTLDLVLYREPQQVPLDLSVNTFGSTDERTMTVTATTVAGAKVQVLTHHSDLDISNLDTTGRFTFIAIFDKIGDNRITIQATDGDKVSTVNYDVYYLPSPDIYTKKAWPLTAEGYGELLSNIQVRAANNQVYVVKGVVQRIEFEKPQRVIIYTSEDGKSQPVLVENKTKKKWEVGKYYRIYADASSTYNSMPLLIGRFSYDK